MAIYQFQMTVIPKKGVLEKYGRIPEKLKINYEERKRHYNLKEEGLLDEDDHFEDALTQDWWSSTNILPIEIIHQIDKKVKRAHYSKDTHISWKFYSQEVDNDAYMLVSEETGKIEELVFRADLREVKWTFLREMIELAATYDWLLMDVKGNLVFPKRKEVGKLIKKSNSHKFLIDPMKFLKELDDNPIE